MDARTRWRAHGAALGAALLCGCQATMPSMPSMPSALADLPFVGSGVPSALAPGKDLPPPVERSKWPDPSQDVINQRARGYGLVAMPEMQAYLNGLFARVKKTAGVPNWPGSVYVLAAPTLDAYATAAGNVYISQGWLSLAESEDEIVALLSHELGHVYLHYHQLAGVVQDSNTVAGTVAIGVAIARKTSQMRGWTPVDSLLVSYTVSRNLATSAWGRSQEAAADGFGLNVSLKMGYSYDGGFKAFLERLSSWEEDNLKRQKATELQLRAKAKEDARQATLKDLTKPGSGPASAWVATPMADFSGDLAEALAQGTQGIGGLLREPFKAHPDTQSRLDALARAVEPLPEKQVSKEPVTREWQQAVRQPRSAAILKSHTLAAQALQDVSNPASLGLARQAVAGPGGRMALPAMALYRTQLAAAGNPRAARSDHGAMLDANLASEADRAWAVYVERGMQLQGSGQGAAARTVMDQGLAFFKTAGEAWPQAILFTGQNQNWDQAKRMAQTCIAQYPDVADACRQASATPSEQAEAERKNKQKADSMFEKLKKKI